jgi:16S rRNA (cytidine1402-2'-O)-methyltransferase
LPARAEARSKILDSLRAEARTMVFFEAARRLAAILGAMAAAFGEERRVAVIRELTKTYEETARGTLGELARRFAAERALGEVTIVVDGAPGREVERQRATDLTIEMLQEAGLGLKEASAVIARLTNRSRREVYQEALRTRRCD